MWRVLIFFPPYFFFLVAFIFWFAVETPPTALVLLCLYRRERERTVLIGLPIQSSLTSLPSLFIPCSIILSAPLPQQPPSLPIPLPLSSAFILPLSFPLFFFFSPFPVCFVSSMSPPPSMASRRRSTWPGALSGSYEKEDKIFCRIFSSLLKRGWAHIKSEIRILFIKFLCWKWA